MMVLEARTVLFRFAAASSRCQAAAVVSHPASLFRSTAFSTSPPGSPPSPPPTGPLVGYKVLDFGQVVAGNFCSGLLAYFGADVIKVEPPARGDALRHLRDLDSTGTSLWWRTYGRNRRCITLDLHKEEGRALARQLAGRVDCLVENFRPGVMEGWGLGPKDLSSQLVYTRISGYGQTGPLAKLPGYASVAEAFSSFRHLNGYADRAPVRPNISLGDSLAGLHAAFGTVMALLHRDGLKNKNIAADGDSNAFLGQVVDAAITESMYNMLEGCVSEYAASGAVRPPSGSTITGVVPSGCWKASDGKYVVIGGNGNSVYNRLMAAVGQPDMGTDNPQFATDSKRCENEIEICTAIERWVASHTSDHVITVLNGARVPAGPIMTIADVMEHPQYVERGMFQKAVPPSGGDEVTVPAMLPVMHGTPGSTRWAGPELGEHTDAVLQEELGMSLAEIAKLRGVGAI